LNFEKGAECRIDVIYGVFNKDLCLKLIEFDKPYILKALDCVAFDIPEYSLLKVGINEFDPDFFDGFSISIEVNGKLKNCVLSNHSTEKYEIKLIDKPCFKYDGVIYNNNIKYILSYSYKGSIKTALISTSGLISNEWDFFDDRIQNELTVSNVLGFLKTFGFESLFSTYQIIEVPEDREKENLLTVYTKPNP